jgi:hypothetical protein
VPDPTQLSRHEYLGDGVYASFDGYHVWLHVGDHRNEPVVALEPEVLDSLAGYAKRLALAQRAQRIAEEACGQPLPPIL